MIKKMFTVLLMCCMLLMTSGCGDDMVINGKNYETVGVFNMHEVENNGVEYRIIPGNVVWSIILVETLVFPIYFVGFSCLEPVGLKIKG